MHNNTPASSDPLWRHSTTIWIPRVPRSKQVTGILSGRTKRTRLIEPSVCHAHGNASRFRRRLHVMEIGVRKSGTRKDSTTFLASTGTKVGMPLNPTGILVCGLQSGTHVPGEFEKLLDGGDWCEECRASLRSWVDVRKIREELGT